MHYLILEWTPFPGYFEPMALCFLQQAEYELGLNQHSYHERAQRVGEWLVYRFEDAQQIINWRRKQFPQAKHLLFSHYELHKIM